MRRIASILLAAALAGAGPARAATYHVDAGTPGACDDEGPGTESAPWCSIQIAAETMVAGDTVIVHEGVYREAVRPASPGTPDAPVTYRAADGEHVVVTGADPIVGWQPCSAETCPGAPLPEATYWVDLDWLPAQLFEDGDILSPALEPDGDWWPVPGGTDTTLVDESHLCSDCLPGITQLTGTWAGGSVVHWDRSISIRSEQLVLESDPVTSTIRIDADWDLEPGVDLYRLVGRLPLLDEPGEWVIDATEDACRLWMIPLGGDPSAALVEGSRRGRFVIEYGTMGWLRFEGFEITAGAGHGIGTWSSPYPEGVEIVGNHVHHNAGTGIYLRDSIRALVRDNDVDHQPSGVSGGIDSVIEYNEIHHNHVDGLWPGDGCVVRGNHIHDHVGKNHPDNVQMCCSPKSGLVFVGNLIVNGGQCFMLEQVDDSAILDNVIIGSTAQCVIFGHGTVHRWEMNGNTIVLTGYRSVAMTGHDYVLANNIFLPGGTSYAFSNPGDGAFESDHNLFWNPETCERGVVHWNGENYGGVSSRTFAEYQETSALDAHSVEADPLFANFPACMAQSTSPTLCTTTVAYMRDNEDCFEPGDHVELNFDGVLRTVEEVGRDEDEDRPWIRFSPPLEDRLWHGFLVLNWKDGTDLEIDVTPSADSPACHMADDGLYVGALPCAGQEARPERTPSDIDWPARGCGCALVH